MIDWEKIKENYSLEDFCNIIERNKPNKNNKLYKEWFSLYQDIVEELDNKLNGFFYDLLYPWKRGKNHAD